MTNPKFMMSIIKMSAITPKYRQFLRGRLWTRLLVESYQYLYYAIKNLLKCTNSYLLVVDSHIYNTHPPHFLSDTILSSLIEGQVQLPIIPLPYNCHYSIKLSR